MLGPERLNALYGVHIEGQELLLLMRHRAVLLGLVGVLMLVGAFRPRLQPVAFAVGLVSVISFLLLALPFAGHNPPVMRVILADTVALAGLVTGATAALLIARRVDWAGKVSGNRGPQT